METAQMIRFLAPFSLIACVAAAPAVFAADTQLNLAGLDFSKPADVAAFETRLAAIQGDLCGAVTGTRIGESRTCRKGVEEEVMEKLSASQRRALAAAKAEKKKTQTAGGSSQG
jgi:UrcA family protein